MSDNFKEEEINEIIMYNGNNEDFKKYNETLNQPLNLPTIYYDKKKN